VLAHGFLRVGLSYAKSGLDSFLTLVAALLYRLKVACIFAPGVNGRFIVGRIIAVTVSV
jgi:hypothetical protein